MKYHQWEAADCYRPKLFDLILHESGVGPRNLVRVSPKWTGSREENPMGRWEATESAALGALLGNAVLRGRGSICHTDNELN